MNHEFGSELSLSASTAYDAMCLFLDAYARLRGTVSADLATLLGGLQRLESDGMPIDQAFWSDWMDAVERAKAG
jgi:hypothetical protein